MSYFKSSLKYEKASSLITATFKDELGVAIPNTDFTAINMTLFLLSDPTQIVNARDNQNVLNANNCTVDANGLFSWNVQPGDRAMISTTVSEEIHRAEIRYKWAGGNKEGVAIIDLPVINLVKTS